MKNVLLALLLCFVGISTSHAKDVHTFACSDSDKTAEPSATVGKTDFTWTKNGDVIFRRVFSDSFSEQRNQYVTFYCEKNIIRYRLHSCGDPTVAPLCTKPVTVAKRVVQFSQQSVATSATLVDGEDYQFITHYKANTVDGSTVLITGLDFVNNVDGNNSLSEMERQASSQYNYTLMGPNSELVSGVTSSNGQLIFDLLSHPISIGPTPVNIGIAAQPKQHLKSTGNSGIRWVLNPAIGGRGVSATKNGSALTYNEIEILNSRLQIFSRGISGLKISHFNPQETLLEPSASAQPFYRLRVENISSENQAQLARLTLEMRLIGMQKKGGDLNINDFSLVEIGPTGSVLSTPNYQLYKVEDLRNNDQNFSFQVELSNFVVAPNESRGLEFRIAHTTNDSVGKNDDDGVAVQMRTEPSKNGNKSFASELNDAFWIWTDFSGEVVNGERNDWRSGLNLEVNNQPIIILE